MRATRIGAFCGIFRKIDKIRPATSCCWPCGFTKTFALPLFCFFERLNREPREALPAGLPYRHRPGYPPLMHAHFPGLVGSKDIQPCNKHPNALMSSSIGGMMPMFVRTDSTTPATISVSTSWTPALNNFTAASATIAATTSVQLLRMSA